MTMHVTRLDLDGRGSGSPEGLVSLILKAEKDLPIPIPIEDLCYQLDISNIAALDTEGYEGALITDASRSAGIILVNTNGRTPQRQRFTIAHELGHFLIATHMPNAEDRFLCSREDMRCLTAKENDRRARMEVEANRFASLILIPPPMLRAELKRKRSPDLQHIPQLARTFQVSKEAMARAYADYHDEPIAIVVTQAGHVSRCYRNRTRFPFIHVENRHPIPRGSLYHRGCHDCGVASAKEDCDPDMWVSPAKGQRLRGLTEQVYLQQENYALIMLHVDIADEEDEEEERDLAARWQVGFRRR